MAVINSFHGGSVEVEEVDDVQEGDEELQEGEDTAGTNQELEDHE